VIAPRPEWKNAAEEKIGGLIFLGSPTTDDEATWTPDAEQELKCAFTRVKQLAANLREAADRGGALLATVARLDGAFGLRGTSFNALQGGLSGLAKTAAHEWPTVRCRALDVSANWQEVDAVADALACELSADGPLEVGLDDGQRVGLETTVSPAAPGSLLLEDGDVVVISGGARGVTADAALALARARRLTLVLLGRSPAPTSEPDWLVGLSEEAAIKRALLAHGFDKRERPSPAELEAEYRRAMANREIGQNLERLRATGSTAVYHSVDVRDAEAVAELLAELRREYGPVRGLIHGAGVIADRHIADKTPDQFDRVFDTKVAGLRALLGATAEDELKCLALFSSASARFGRQGQVDYAMANEVLNKVAHQQAALRPGCRVVAINWGPWDGGMVTRALKSEFAREGIELIPREAGARCLVEELSTRDRTQIEVLIGASFPRPQAETPAPKRRAIENVPGGAHLAIAFERELEVQTHPFLRSHVLNGHPVLPVAMILEWLSHGALHDNPGLVLHGFDDFRVLKGVVLDSGPKTVCVCAAPAERYSDLFHVRVELRSGQPGEHELGHARATVLLATRWPAPPKFELPADLTAQPYAPGLEAVYRDILFHGPHFQSIRRITGISARGMVAEVRPAPPPSEWMSEPLRSSWLSDPVVVDGGLQLGVLWCHQELGAVALPSYGARYRQYQPFPPADVTTVLEVRETGPQLMAADLTFLDSAGQVIAQMQRAEWTVDASLRDAFVQNALVGV
jgi:NAD(P)-dependent dehydrogenase (short-subunit alcohol dehydrogenase family)